MKRTAIIILVAGAALALSAGVARAVSTLPGTHVKGVTANCHGDSTHVDIHLSDVPAGTQYLVVFTGALQGSPHGTTDGGDITVNFPGSCKCDQTFTVDVSLDRGPAQLSEDTPFHNVPIKCEEKVTTTTSSIPVVPPPSVSTSTTSTTQTTSTSTSTTPTTGSSTTTTAPGTTPPVQPPRNNLPSTGSNTQPFALLGGALVAGGAALIGRRRNR